MLIGTRPPFHLTKDSAAGDTIEFTFQLPTYIKDGTDVQHTATQSTFEAPCTPKGGGFDTSLQTTTMTGGKSFTLTVRTGLILFPSFVQTDLYVHRSTTRSPYGMSESGGLFAKH